MAASPKPRTIEADVSALAEAISPELVLVSPPEVAQLERARLDDWSNPRPSLPPRVAQPRALELLAVYAFCLAITVGPLGFIIAATP
jgi:hypothetical protein